MSAVPILDEFPTPPLDKSGWPWNEPVQLLPEKMPNGAEWPRISIVTPSYNQGEFIEETIRSVLLQGYPNLEYIIIDGGSTDNSVEIIKKYAQWLYYWVSEEDRGQSDALNKGFARSTGDICAYINSDDMFLKNTLLKVALSHHQNQGCSWFAFSVLCGENLTNSQIWLPSAANLAYFVVNQTIAQPGVFWLGDIQPKPWFDLDRNINMDHKFFIEIYMKIGSPYIIPETAAFFRWHPNSKTSRRSEVWDREYQELIKEISGQVDYRTALAIQQEEVRLRHSARIAELLSSKPKSIVDKWSRIAEAFKIITKTPFVFRDRIFVSALVRLCT